MDSSPATPATPQPPVVMAHRLKVPFRAQDVGEVSAMVEALETATKAKKRAGISIKKNNFILSNGRTVSSWRMLDWDYKKENLPTYARGLFTGRNVHGQHEILVRGYDKFFNHGEVRKTEWPNVMTQTRGPYELSVKENGCIIFIAGLEDDSLLVCSKHSTGTRGDVEKSHSSVGEKWVDVHLEKVGKTRADLARKLREMNATAVAELCDDTFEEHVLAYPPEMAGLYLHGINLNVPEFVTYPGSMVAQFAAEWGFKTTMYVMEEDISRVKTFLDEVAETGAYAGRDTEGFVIRCQARDAPSAPWHDWFFKYKFEEPYLMYRQWRECTKAVIAGKSPRIRKHKTITEEYLLFARRRLAQDPTLGKRYNQNHGIIGLRDDFLASRGTTGADIIKAEMAAGDESSAPSHNIVLVPIATIGCGKTTLALALTKLFGWGHFQNDNVEGRQRRPQRFASSVCMQLASHPAVIADRNNHQRREREQLFQDVSKIVPNATFVALHWVHDRGNYDAIRTALRDRVLARGDKHQTIHTSKGEDEIISIMDGFMDRFQRVDTEKGPDTNFDTVIDLDVLSSTRENLETVITKLHAEYPRLFRADKSMPSADEMDAAIEWALAYEPTVKHDLTGAFGKNSNKAGGNKGKGKSKDRTTTADATTLVHAPAKPRKVEYFGAQLPTARITSILTALFADLRPHQAKFYHQLHKTRRIQPAFHVTLAHRSAANGPARAKEIWERLVKQREEALEAGRDDLGPCRVLLERVVWDGRVMAFVVRLLDEWACANRVAHVTVGTAAEEIKPAESNKMLERWEAGEEGVDDVLVKGNVVLDGVVTGVLRKF